ncbi:MAG: glycosyltransferase family 4 protein, partial [Candidatus Thermoplasmatota archaeon]|nr:glycosyltransferase family 4 protein [Candidatus Thermoplasmatota archaeon]
GSNRFFKKNLHLADLVTAVSKPLYDYATDFGCENVRLVTNGVELDRFQPDMNVNSLKNKLGLNNHVLGFVGALERWIDLEIPLSAFPRVLEKVPDAQFLIVGGSIKSGYETRLREMTKELGLEKNVIFTGFVPYETVPSYINAMNVALIPFRMGLYMAQIALPDKFFEYIACGKTTLSTRLPEVVRVGGKSIHFYEDENNFVEEATKLLTNPGRAEELLNIAKRYDWKNIAAELAQHFECGLSSL